MPFIPPTQDQLFTSLYNTIASSMVPPSPTINNGVVSAYVDDCYVEPGIREANVRVWLDNPPNQSMKARVLTFNDTAIENQHFTRVDQYVTFMPGEVSKIIRIPLKADLGTKRFRLSLIQPQNTPGNAFRIADADGYIYGGTPAQRTPDVPLPKKMYLAFEDRFSNPNPTPSGFLSDGVTPTWRGALDGGRREQPGTAERGFYGDPTLYPGTTPWLVDPVTGKFAIQAEYQPNGVKDVNGVQQICAWDGGIPYFYSSSCITTERLFHNITTGDYIEGRMTIPQVVKSWPAFWMIADDNSWPSIEFDFFEGFNTTGAGWGKVGITVHWKGGQFSSFLPDLMYLDITQPHTWGCYWGVDWVDFYVDRVRVFSVPNIFPPKTCFLMLDVTVSTKEFSGTTPPAGFVSNFPAKMPLDFVRVFKPVIV